MKTEDLNNINMLHMLDQMLAEIRTSAEMKYDQLQETNLELRKEITKLQAECKELQASLNQTQTDDLEKMIELKVQEKMDAHLKKISENLTQKLEEFLNDIKETQKTLSEQLQPQIQELLQKFESFATQLQKLQ